VVPAKPGLHVHTHAVWAAFDVTDDAFPLQWTAFVHCVQVGKSIRPTAHRAEEVMTRFPPPEFATATYILFPKPTESQALFVAAAREVHVIPFGDVMTKPPAPVSDTATKRSFPKVTERHKFWDAGVRPTQLIPSEEVMTALLPTATKRLFPKVTDVHARSGADRPVHVAPLLEEVMTAFAVPPSDTATKRLFPNVTLVHAFPLEEGTREVHVTPSGEVIARFFVLPASDPEPTATKTLFPNATEDHIISLIWAIFHPCGVQLIPLSDIITREAPLNATATKRLFPKVTEYQLQSSGVFCKAHVIPLEEVITRFPATPGDPRDTATQRLFPKVTPRQKLSAADVWETHVF